MGTIGKRVLWGVAAVALITAAVLIGYRYDITLWDWVKILIVPAAIAIGVAWLNRAQERERHAQEAQREREREATEEARREREREAQAAQRERELEVENQRAQDAALQAYLDQMGQLLLDKERPLRQSKGGDEVRTLVRALTLTMLRRLDSERKRNVLQFLYESDLINRANPILSLSGADLQGANLREINLQKADLRFGHLEEAQLQFASLLDTDLRGIHLEWADLYKAMLRGADLSRAALGDADLRYATVKDFVLMRPFAREEPHPLRENPPAKLDLPTVRLEEADLSRADLRGAFLRSADLSGAILRGANLSRPTLELTMELLELKGFVYFDESTYETDLSNAKLRRAILVDAELSGTNLSGADLRRTDLRSAVLNNADLRDAMLSDAKLSGAHGWTVDQLSKARTLEGATMPDGQTLKSSAIGFDGPTFEEWLKDRVDREEDGENE